MTTVNTTDRISVVLSEFTALRSEIGTRTTAQNSLVNITAIATGGIGSYALSGAAANRLAFFVLVPLVVAMGLQWLDHAHAIFKTGTYIKTELWRELRESVRDPLTTWEEYVLEDVHPWRERSVLIIPFFVLFVGPGVGALIILSRQRISFAGWLVWAIEALAILYFCWIWAGVLRDNLKKQEGSEAKSEESGARDIQ